MSFIPAQFNPHVMGPHYFPPSPMNYSSQMRPTGPQLIPMSNLNVPNGMQNFSFFPSQPIYPMGIAPASIPPTMIQDPNLHGNQNISYDFQSKIGKNKLKIQSSPSKATKYKWELFDAEYEMEKEVLQAKHKNLCRNRQFLEDTLNFIQSIQYKNKVLQSTKAHDLLNRESTEWTSGESFKPKSEKNTSIVYPNGEYYEGSTKYGERHGKGVYHYLSGCIYEGEFFNGLKDGKGLLISPYKNMLYEGEFRKDLFDGQGTQYNEFPEPFSGSFNYHNLKSVGHKWLKYEGGFDKSKKAGRGVIYFVNGEKFEGEFLDDAANGEGTFFKTDGTTIRGLWKDNNLFHIL